VSEGIKLYEKKYLSKESPLATIIDDQEKREVYSEMMSEIAKSQAANMTADQLSARGKAGAAARLRNTTPEQRKRQAVKAVKERWAKRKQGPPD
jgi:hypothetical protein